jgi:phospholipid/cholesterol/gamma-HCH transport system ATP-binding protein
MVSEINNDKPSDLDPKVAIDVRNIYKTFAGGRYKVYQGISLKIPKNKITFLLGPSGVGKSVLLKHILGLLEPDSGEIYIFGEPIPYRNPSKLNELRKHFGMCFQNAALFDDFTVYENVAFPLREHRSDMSEEEIYEKVCSKISAVNLDPNNVLDKYPSELSGGMKKRVAVARAIVLEPEILLYDEPTTGLDPVTRATIDDLIISTNEKFGLTSLVISHDIPSAVYSADYITFLYGGKIVFWGTPDEFLRCEHPVAKQFIEAEQRHRKASEGWV